MSSLHRNALMPDYDMCLRCGAPVELPADYCDLCAQGMPSEGPKPKGSGASAPASPVAKPCAHNQSTTPETPK